ncbi:MAG: acetylxylan esterase [Acidobacteria bacterium]|nr:acetylxylan esterase [Acidobacteriota bacterium]
MSKATCQGVSWRACLHTLFILLLWSGAASLAQENASTRHQQFLDFLKKTAASISSQPLSGIESLENWKQRRPELRRQLLYMVGLEPMPKRTPLRAQIAGTLQRPNYRIEKIVFQSLPGLYVTANFYVPHQRPGPLPAILYVCGHSPHPKGAKQDYQDRAIWFASNGFAVLVLDTLEFGEVPGLHHGIHDLNLWHWLSLGYTPIGVEVWNAMRALDYLETRTEVDKQRIGMTGISGGGSATWYTAALDERIAAAAPVCATYTFGSQAAHWVAAGQCDCIYFHNTYLTDFPLVGALVAPRPLSIFSGQRDLDFPPDGYHAVFNQVKKIYDLYGGQLQEERVRELDDDVGHEDAPPFLKAAREWMRKWLKNDHEPYREIQVTKEPAEDLAVLSRLPADAINYRIHNQFISTATLQDWPSKSHWEKRRGGLMQELRDKVFRWFPQQPAPFETSIVSKDGGWGSRYADYREVVFATEPGVRVRAQLFAPKLNAGRAPVLVYVKRSGDSIYRFDLDELLPLLGRYTVLVLNPRMTEHPVNAFEYAEIERTASWIGRTVASMQVWDILRSVEWLVRDGGVPASSISVYGKGDMGILALYAGLFDERIHQIILSDPPGSHWKGPALLNVLRVTDIPEVAGAFAPRRLISLTDLPHSFEHARKIYELHSRSANLSQAGSLPEALEVWRY